ncbi:hypothetical protein HPULCUR_001554 [Helicostylum pulchrum]|uniref:BHLH domain-containing protein n=1 Tax=Helicostylum pulchrum TaxID=562976 RepID=A0ABP9XN07_9FUNG
MDSSTGYPTASTINLYNIHLQQQRQNQLQMQYPQQHQQQQQQQQQQNHSLHHHNQFPDPNTPSELVWENHKKHANSKSSYILSPPEDHDCNYRQQHYQAQPNIYYNNDKSAPVNEFYHENPNPVKTEDTPSLFIDSSLHRQPIITTNMHVREDNMSESSSNNTIPSVDSTVHKNTPVNRKQAVKTEVKKSNKPNVVIEKKRYRRESHNAVERRRRNNINDNIKSLGQLLPDNMREGKLNKGSILKGSVVYIHMLNEQLSKYKERLESLQYEAANISAISARTSI